MIQAKIFRWHTAILVLVIGVIFLLYWPSLRWMVNSWLSSDYYSHGFLVPLVSGFLIWTRRNELAERNPSLFGSLWLFAGVALFILSFVWDMKVLGVLSFLCIIASMIFFVFGIRAAKAILFPLVFLLFMVPFKFLSDLAYNLQYMAVNWSAGITEILGLPITTTGTEIHLGKITFTVGIVCSGINSLIALLALSAVYAHILKGQAIKRFGLFAVSFPIAIVMNVLRIVSVILLVYFTNLDTGMGWHDISSPIFFFAGFMLLVLVGRLLKFRINYDFMVSNIGKH